jgi:regulatory protein
MPKLQLSLKGRALRYLSMREHSRQELGRKLARYAQEGDDVESVLDFLESAKFLSQSRFSEALVHRRAARFGNSRIVMELQSHGLDGGLIEDAKAGLSETEAARALVVWQRKFNRVAENNEERIKQHRFLQQRGFSHQAIKSAMGGQTAPECDELTDTYEDS